MKDLVVTIGRQFGSGGRQIGALLAKKLGIPFYDEELIAEAAKKMGIKETLFEEIDEKAANSLLYSIAMGNYSAHARFNMFNDIPLNDKLFQVQAEIIRQYAAEGPCVIVGRCADYILEEVRPCLNVFIHADLPHRVERATKEYGFPEAGIRQKILKADRQRSNYYDYYTDKTWGQLANYHISLDSGILGIEGCAHMLAEYMKG